MKKSLLALNWMMVATLSGSLLTGCGREDEEKKDKKSAQSENSAPSDDSSMVQDSSLSQEVIGASLTDSMEALADSNGESTSGASLALVDTSYNRDIERARKCDERDTHAIVTLSHSIDRMYDREGPYQKIHLAVSGQLERVRDWSRDGQSVKCAADGKHAEINWFADTTGLHVDVNFSRQRALAFERYVRGRLVAKRDHKFSAQGKRRVDWLAQSSLAGGNILRSKKIASDVVRKLEASNRNGEVRSIEVQVKTADDAPLMLDVERVASSLELKSKTLKTGKIIASRANDGRVEVSFDNLKTLFSNGLCKVDSGKALIAVYKDGQAEPVRKFEFKAEAGDYTLTDLISGEVKEDFDFEGCHYADFQK